jgi:Acetyltransferase (GNAT) domain
MSVSLTNTENGAAAAARTDSRESCANEPLKVFVYSKLEELPQPFLNLFTEAGLQSVFLTLPWFENFIQNAMPPEDLVRIYAVSAGETAAGMLVMRAAGRSKRLLSLRKLEGLANYYSCFYAPHLTESAGESRGALRALVLAIRQEEPSWDAIDIKLLDSNSEIFLALMEELRAAGFVVQNYFCSGNWFEPMKGKSYREYFEGLRSSVRNIAKSKNKKVERTGRVRCEIITGAEGLEAGIAAYEKVYAASWKVPEPFPQFIPGLLRTCATHGMLRLGVAYVDGVPAAAQIWIVHSGVASIYKIAYDRAFRELSVGTYLTTRMMEHAIDVDRVQEVDYLTGDDAYKKDWMSQRRERWGILALNPRTPRGMLAIARHVGGRAVKRAAVSLAKPFRRGKSRKNTA